MSEIFIEYAESPRITYSAQYPMVTRRYKASGMASETTVRTYISVYVPTYYDLNGDGSIILPRMDVDVEPETSGVWMVSVTYRRPDYGENPMPETPAIKEINSGIQFSALATTANVKRGATLPTVYTALSGTAGTKQEEEIRAKTAGYINVDASGESSGIDVFVPAFEVTLSRVLPRANLTNVYMNTIKALTAKVNNDPFFADSLGNPFFERGECLFLGAEGGQRADGDWELTFRFVGAENSAVEFTFAGITVGSEGGSEPAKYGHEYIWAYAQTKKVEISDGIGGDSTIDGLEVIGALVEQVYETGDFEELRLWDDTFFRL